MIGNCYTLSTFKATNDFNKQRVSIAKLNSRALERIPTRDESEVTI